MSGLEGNGKTGSTKRGREREVERTGGKGGKEGKTGNGEKERTKKEEMATFFIQAYAPVSC